MAITLALFFWRDRCRTPFRAKRRKKLGPNGLDLIRFHLDNNWLLVLTILKNMSLSMGRIIYPTYIYIYIHIYIYPLVNCHITMERSTIFDGKTHYK